MAKVLIVGAGMSGVAAARELTLKGYEVELFEKSRGVGGRMSTRRMSNARADHGAQYYSTRTSDFQLLTKEMKEGGVVKPWKRFEKDKYDRYVGIKGMSSIPKYLAQSLKVNTQEKVVQISKLQDGFEIKCESGNSFLGDYLIITIPAPQAIDLLLNSKIDTKVVSTLSQIEYDPCFALMVHTNNMVDFKKNKIESGPYAWQMSNTQKGMTEKYSYTLHTSHSFSIEHLENPVDQTKAVLLSKLPSCFEEVEILESQLHRWRFSIARKRYPSPFLLSESGIYFGGDGFGNGNVEGAFVSGLRMARDLISKL